MRSPITAIENAIVSLEPKRRRRLAIHLLIWSFLLGVVNMTGWALGYISDAQMLAITACLSWLAITITAADIVATTDVRAEAECTT